MITITTGLVYCVEVCAVAWLVIGLLLWREWKRPRQNDVPPGDGR